MYDEFSLCEDMCLCLIEFVCLCLLQIIKTRHGALITIKVDVLTIVSQSVPGSYVIAHTANNFMVETVVK